MPGRTRRIMSRMPSRVMVMAFLMASISQGFLMVRIARRWGRRLRMVKNGYSFAAFAAKRSASFSGSPGFSRSMSRYRCSYSPLAAALWKRNAKSSTQAMDSMPESALASSALTRRPFQRSRCASGGRMKSVSVTVSPFFSARNTNLCAFERPTPVRYAKFRLAKKAW